MTEVMTSFKTMQEEPNEEFRNNCFSAHWMAIQALAHTLMALEHFEEKTIMLRAINEMGVTKEVKDWLAEDEYPNIQGYNTAKKCQAAARELMQS